MLARLTHVPVSSWTLQRGLAGSVSSEHVSHPVYCTLAGRHEHRTICAAQDVPPENCHWKDYVMVL